MRVGVLYFPVGNILHDSYPVPKFIQRATPPWFPGPYNSPQKNKIGSSAYAT